MDSTVVSKRIHPVLAVFLFAVQLIWVGFMIAVVIGRCVLDGLQSCIHGYVEHFTYWAWTIYIVFYLATAALPFVEAGLVDEPLTSFFVLIVQIFYVPIFGLAMIVMSLVIIMLATGADFLDQDLLAIPLSRIIVGDAALHFHPVLAIWAWSVIHIRFIYYALNQLFAEPAIHHDRLLFWGMLAYQMFGGVFTLVVAYMTFWNPNLIYGSDMHLLLGIAVIFILLLVYTSPLPIFLLWYSLGERPLLKRFIHESEFYADEDREVISYWSLDNWARGDRQQQRHNRRN